MLRLKDSGTKGAIVREEVISQEKLSSVEWVDSYFKFCHFDGLSVEGQMVDSDFVDCRFTNLDWYWGLFNCANFINCTFENCRFAGTSFPDTRFVDCKLLNCTFRQDNLGGDCDLTKTIAYGCTVENCSGFPPHLGTSPMKE